MTFYMIRIYNENGYFCEGFQATSWQEAITTAEMFACGSKYEFVLNWNF